MVTTAMSKIVSDIESQKTVKKQVELLQKHDSSTLKEILIFSCSPVVEWQLPSGNPPYTPLAEGTDQEGRLYSEVKKLDYFVNTPKGLELNSMKKEQMFIELMETIDPGDAKLLLRMKAKELKIKKEALKQVYPGENW
jgi:hypothetical protein